MKHFVNEVIRTYDIYDLEGSIEDLIQILQNIRDKYPGEIRIDTEYEYPFYSDHERDAVIKIILRREENDAEKQERLSAERMRLESTEKREYEQYLRLKEKFGES